MVKVKICGITNLEDAQAAVASGCDALGFNFYKKSPRYIELQEAKKIIAKFPKKIIRVGIFVNEKAEKIREAARVCRLNFLQFHGNESPEFCAKFKNFKVIKAFRVKGRLNLKEVIRYNTFAYLFDAFTKTKAGGTGKSFNWRFLDKIDKLRKPIFLSGGLDPRNVKSAIKAINPDWVDACSLLETRPGKKNHIKMKKFIAEAQ